MDRSSRKFPAPNRKPIILLWGLDWIVNILLQLRCQQDRSELWNCNGVSLPTLISSRGKFASLRSDTSPINLSRSCHCTSMGKSKSISTNPHLSRSANYWSENTFNTTNSATIVTIKTDLSLIHLAKSFARAATILLRLKQSSIQNLRYSWGMRKLKFPLMMRRSSMMFSSKKAVLPKDSFIIWKMSPWRWGFTVANSQSKLPIQTSLSSRLSKKIPSLSSTILLSSNQNLIMELSTQYLRPWPITLSIPLGLKNPLDHQRIVKVLRSIWILLSLISSIFSRESRRV